MKPWVALPVSILLLTASAVFSGLPALADGQKSVDEQLLEEIRLLRETVTALETKVVEVEKKMAEIIRTHGELKEARTVPVREYLDGIVLAENAGPEEVREYIRKVLEPSRNRTRLSTNDPEIGKLKEVGPDNLAILIEFRGHHRGFYVILAMSDLVQEEHKDLILEALSKFTYSELPEYVIKFGWEEDAREILLSRLQAKEPHLPSTWLKALATLEDPETYDMLVDYFATVVNSGYADAYEAIKDLPVDLDEVVNKAWQRFGVYRPSEWDMNTFAPIAVSHGVSEALFNLFIQVDVSQRRYTGVASPRDIILRHTEATGSDEELLEWYKQNRENLVFDKETRVFRVKRDAEQ